MKYLDYQRIDYEKLDHYQRMEYQRQQTFCDRWTLLSVLGTVLMAGAVSLILDTEYVGRRKIKGQITLPIATGNTCLHGDTTTTTTTRVANAVHEISSHSARRAIIPSHDVTPDLAKEVDNLHSTGQVDLAWELPLNPTPNHILQSAMDHHLKIPVDLAAQPYAVAYSASDAVHIFNPLHLPQIELTVPMFCKPPRGVSAWQGVGQGRNTTKRWKEMEDKGVKVVSVRELMALRPRRGDVAAAVVSGVGHIRSAALVDAAMSLIEAAEFLLGALPAQYSTMEAQSALQLLRKATAQGDEGALDVITSLIPPLRTDTAAAGALPFSFLPPSPDSSMQYEPTPLIYLPLTEVPSSLDLLVFNPTAADVKGPTPFFFYVKTEEMMVLSATSLEGVCEVTPKVDESESNSNLMDSDSDSEDGASMEHEVVCLLSNLVGFELRKVVVSFREGSAQIVSGTSASDANLIANFVTSVAYKGNRRFVISNGGTATTIRLSPMREIYSHARPFDPVAVFRATLVVVVIAIAVAQVKYARSSHHYPVSRRADQMCVCLAIVLFVWLPLPVNANEVAYYAIPIFIVARWCGLKRSMLVYLFCLTKILQIFLVGGVFGESAWNSVEIGGETYVQTTTGRVADEMVMTYEEIDVTTTLTLWHGDVPHLDIEHWAGPDTVPFDMRITIEGAASAVLREGPTRHRYKPHLSRRGNTFTTSQGISLKDLPQDLRLHFRPTLAVSVLSVSNNLHMDVRLGKSEGFMMSLGEEGGATKAPHLLVVNPVGVTEMSGVNSSLLNPELKNVTLVRMRDVSVAGGEEELVFTYHSKLSSDLLATQDQLCRLPRCRNATLYRATHLGDVMCVVSVVHGEHISVGVGLILPGNEYASFRLSRNASLCAKTVKNKKKLAK